MLVPIEWLNEYTKTDVDVDVLCERMIMSGSNIETVEHFGEEIEKVVIGKIVSIEKHPDADKLIVTKVDVAQGEPLQIVTGATNLFEGAIIPVALHGSKLPGGVTIKKGKLRGVESNGMLCSCKELGFDDKVVPLSQRDGIMIINSDVKIGEDALKELKLNDYIIDFEITPNRPDCLSMVGMAREVAATFDGKLVYPDTKCENESGKAKDYIEVEIKNADLCKRYAARIVTDVKIKESPWWLQKRLIHAGMRPINNIVDITNYVMLEYGQPIHAFDIRNVHDSKIIVDTATEGEKFTTLDGVERTLTSDMLLIKDGKRGVAIAGVMGGLNSEIESDTTTILVESANFNGDSVRATSKKLGLRTEASSRFEKGIDPNLCEVAADRVCRLIEMLGAGTVAKGIVDEYPAEVEAETVKVRVDRVNSVLGIELTEKEMCKIFESLEMKVNVFGKDIKVTPPTVRQDLEMEIDFIEEIARMYGYDKMPVTIPRGNSEAKSSREWKLKGIIREALTAMGANEIQTYSFVSPKGVEKIGIDEDSWENNFVRIINPLGEENSVMRTILTPNMLEILLKNYSRNIPEARAFEIGNTFMEALTPEADNLPDEQDSLVVACYGKGESFFTLKGMIEELFQKLGLENVKFIGEEEYGVYHPGRCARIFANDVELGIMGEVHPDVTEKFDIGTRCYCAEFLLDQVFKYSNTEILYSPLPKYPSMVRDIALVVEEEGKAADLIDSMKNNGGNLLESVTLFDVFRGKNVPEGKKSVAFSLVYRATDRTLTEDEVTKVHENVLKKLEEELGAHLRDA